MADRKNISSNRMRLKIKFESKPRHYFEKKINFLFQQCLSPTKHSPSQAGKFLRVCVCVCGYLTKNKQTNLFQIFIFENLVPYRHKKNSPDQEQPQKPVFWDDWQVCFPGKVSVLWLGVKSYGLGSNPQLCRSETKSLKIFKVGKLQRDWVPP